MKMRLKTLAFVVIFMAPVLVCANDFIKSLEYRDALIQSHGDVLLHLINNTEVQKSLDDATHEESSLMDILLKDLHWKENSKFRNKITHNRISSVFKKLINDPQYSFSEFMLTDGFGALLASFPVTSDYWQGDESKFIQPIIRHGLYVSEPKWDESTSAYSFFLSLAIFKKGNLIGVLVSGVDVSSEYMMDMPLQDLLNLPIHDHELLYNE
jgi:hypothetical protein